MDVEVEMDFRPILLVEDNPDDVELTIRAFEKNSVRNEVVVARDGAHALELLFGKGGNGNANQRLVPSLVLLDLKIPNVGGFEVLKRMREHSETRLIPVVILTSSKEELDIVNGYTLGANSYVSKPIDYQQYLDAVQQMATYWLSINEPVPEGSEWTGH